MPSLVAWLDHNEEQRRRMREVIDLFREHDTLDEIGIGSIRDSFSEILFPGTSTIHTRARYLLFIPWIYGQLERQGVTSNQAALEARRLQVDLIRSLEAGGESGGVIGIEAKASLKRLPDEVYWFALRSYGIRLFQGSIGDYHRSLDSYHHRLGQGQRRAESEELYDPVRPNWHAHLPSAPADFLLETTLSLSLVEAEYLRERVVARHPDSVLAYLLQQPPIIGSLDFPWDHDGIAEFPTHLQVQLLHGRNFSEVMHGAALLYNLMLAQKAVQRGLAGEFLDLVDRYERDIQVWADMLGSRADTFSSWNREEFWNVAAGGNQRISLSTRSFIDTWLDVALNKPASIATNAGAHALLDQREQSLKRGQARLHNDRALELWNGASGTRRHDYRWQVSRQMISDIHDGLSNART